MPVLSGTRRLRVVEDRGDESEGGEGDDGAVVGKDGRSAGRGGS